MIGNPFLYRAADVRSGSMAEDRTFVNLFGISALELIKENTHGLWEIPLILISAPGGGKSSLMRIFSPGALHYIQETSSLRGSRQNLSDHMNELGAFKDGEPYALGIWLKMSDEYHSFLYNGNTNQHGLFYAMLNSRIFLSALNGICELKNLAVAKDLSQLTLSLRSGAKSGTIKSWSKWGDENGEVFYNKMADLEASLCDMIDDPFWNGDPSSLSHTALWSIDLLANLDIIKDSELFTFRPLIMLDDVHELAENQIKHLFKLLMSRQLPIPFWVSLRKQALGLENILAERIGTGVEKGRDYQIIDFEKSSRGDFRKRVLEISTLRVQSVAAQIGSLDQEFVNFISDEREEIFLKNFGEKEVQEIKNRVSSAAKHDLTMFQKIASEIENQCTVTHDLCRRLRMLEILIQREVGKKQKYFSFCEISSETLKKHESNKAVVEAAELFLAKEYKLPYYFGALRLITLSSFNIHQFLKLAGSLFDEIMMAIRLDRDADSFISPERQNIIINKIAKDFLREIPIMVLHGNKVFRLIQSIGDMCRNETYRPTAPYAPGVTGTALSMYEFEILVKRAKNGEPPFLELYQTIESAIAYNILEPDPNYKCKGKEFLVLNINRLLCVPFQLPLQKGGFREQKLSTFLKWMKNGHKDDTFDVRQERLWQ